MIKLCIFGFLPLFFIPSAIYFSFVSFLSVSFCYCSQFECQLLYIWIIPIWLVRYANSRRLSASQFTIENPNQSIFFRSIFFAHSFWSSSSISDRMSTSCSTFILHVCLFIFCILCVYKSLASLSRFAFIRAKARQQCHLTAKQNNINGQHNEK